MESLRRFMLMVFGVCLSILVSILVMIKGWGLEPKSWWWIIGVYIVGNIVAHSILLLGRED
jgi:RsiW-degrading membrane proteinase PrsW (M82 family)